MGCADGRNRDEDFRCRSRRARREDVLRFVDDVRRELASYLRIEERELEAVG